MPVCPRCMKSGIESPITIGSIFKGNDHFVDQGILTCTNAQCMMEFPIIDGIPILVEDVRTYVANNVLPILQRNDLPPLIESIVGDCTGPGSLFNTARQHLSCYGFDHYGDFDPVEPENPAMKPGSILTIFEKALQLPHAAPDEMIIDMGCAVGRTSFELAEVHDLPVLGIDLNFGMLKSATQILNNNRYVYPKRKTGVVFETRQFPVHFPRRDKVDFWVCDALNLPFKNNSFSFGLSFNLLDCVPNPVMLLMETTRIMKKNSDIILTTPYDWSEGATPYENWVGGHSQRTAYRGDPEKIFKTLFSSTNDRAALCKEIKITTEIADIPWSVRLHDRSMVHYFLHMTGLKKTEHHP